MSPPLLIPISSCQFEFKGKWTLHYAKEIRKALNVLETSIKEHKGEIFLQGSRITAIDSVGVWILQKKMYDLKQQGYIFQLEGWAEDTLKLMELISQQKEIVLPAIPRYTWLEKMGLMGIAAWEETFALMQFVGESTSVLLKNLMKPAKWRMKQILAIIEKSGFDALPIIGLTSFLLGIVVAYQGADQLKLYSANIFVVDLIGFSMLREFAPLISAILIAGRSGSSYTAEIGTMTVTNEIEALRTLGVEPIELLVWPKILGLLLSLPLLTVFADVAGVLGGMMMARLQLDIGTHDFLDRFSREVPLRALLIGVGKAVVFAYVIATIGCFQGFRTKSNADSVGRQTTRSVVQSIFIMIVADALFSILFSMLNL